MRATQKDRIFFRIPREELRPSGLKRLKLLERYNQYKINLFGIAKSNRFVLPEQGAEINFYLPVFRTWKKYKKLAMHMKLHQSRPDLSNLLKAFEDALILEDKGIANYAGLSKFWVNEPTGRIEIIIHLPLVSSPDNLL